jgi:hypothetical protein
MPYRQPRPGPRPVPEMDEQLFRLHWTVPVLIVSLTGLPHFVLFWLDDGTTVRFMDEVRLITLSDRVLMTVVYALWFGFIAVAIVRRRRELRAHMDRLRAADEAPARVAELPAARIDASVPGGQGGSEEEGPGVADVAQLSPHRARRQG